MLVGPRRGRVSVPLWHVLSRDTHAQISDLLASVARAEFIAQTAALAPTLRPNPDPEERINIDQ